MFGEFVSQCPLKFNKFISQFFENLSMSIKIYKFISQGFRNLTVNQCPYVGIYKFILSKLIGRFNQQNLNILKLFRYLDQ